jgi:glyceraldehyde 3-phosphate dehydrogenase
MTKVAINGFGRIGRLVARAILERPDCGLELVATNDLADAKSNAWLFSRDSVHGRFPGEVSAEGNDLVVNGKRIHVTAERDPAKLPHRELGVELVLECTGFFTDRDSCQKHIDAGAKKVLISAPGGKDVDATVVYGVNHNTLKSSMTVISNASCTTNCLAPLAKVLHEKIGIVHGLMTTIHAYTNDQVLTDVFHKDLRRPRSATHIPIPTKTGAAVAVGLVLPELNGRLDGFSMRIPTITVSCVDLTFVAKRETTKEEIDAVINEAASGKLKGVMAVNTKPLVSIDFNHNPASCTYDATQTRVMGGTFVKVLGWYDNEWGFSNRMLDMTDAFAKAK